MANLLVGDHRLPVQRACRVVRLSRAAYYRPPVPASWRDAAVIAALTDVVARYPRWGFWKCFDRLRVEGRPWNHKHVHRVYCALRLNLPRRTTRRVPRRVRQPLAARACVLACGANYRFNRQLGLGVPRVFMQSAQLETSFPIQEHIDVYLGRALAPGGFAWVVPFMREESSYAKIGLMCETRAASWFREFVERVGGESRTDDRAGRNHP